MFFNNKMWERNYLSTQSCYNTRAQIWIIVLRTSAQNVVFMCNPFCKIPFDLIKIIHHNLRRTDRLH